MGGNISQTKFTIQNYDHYGKTVEYDPSKHGDFAVRKLINGKEYVQEADGKIDTDDFVEALMDYYEDKYGKIRSGDFIKDASNSEVKHFTTETLHLLKTDNIEIIDDNKFQELLEKKADELHTIMARNGNEKPSIGL